VAKLKTSTVLAPCQLVTHTQKNTRAAANICFIRILWITTHVPVLWAQICY